MARKSESGIDWDLERKLASQGYSYYDTEHSTLLAADADNSAYTTGDTDSVFERPTSVGRGRRGERIPEEGLNHRLQSVNISSEVHERHSTEIRGGRELPLPHTNSSGRQASSSDYESSYFTWQDALEEQKMASLAKRPTSSKPTESDQNYLGYNVPVVPPRPPQNVPRQEVRATVWKSPPVQPQTDYRCSDPGIPSSNAPRGTPGIPFPKLAERKKPVAKGPLTIAKETVATKEETRSRAVGRLPTEPNDGDDIITIAVVLPSGKRIKRRFRTSDSLALLQHFISSNQEVPNDFEVGTNCPRRILQCVPTPANPHVYTFEQAGITRNEALFVELPKPGSVSRNLVNRSTMAQPGPHSQVPRIPPRRIPVTGAGAGGGRSRIHSLPSRRPSSGG